MSTPEPATGNEPLRDAAARAEPIREWRSTTTHFGPWWFDRASLTLNLLSASGEHEYQLDLEKRTSNDVALIWLAELAATDWATPVQLGWLTFALNELSPPISAKRDGPGSVRQRLGGLGWL